MQMNYKLNKNYIYILLKAMISFMKFYRGAKGI